MSLKRSAESSSYQSKRVKCDGYDEDQKAETVNVVSENVKQICSRTVAPILKLSDEILLCIMRLLNPRDIVSLGGTCRRLDSVIRDRTLWVDVDLTAEPMMLCQLQEFVEYFHSTTKSIVTHGCVKFVDSAVRLKQQCAPVKMFQELKKTCPALETFAAINHYYDARHVLIADFPATLKKLVLKGCQVYFVPNEKSYFHGINEHMVNLRELILDECQWLTPDALMAISKCPNLRILSLRSCRNVGTCYAYISLSSRFGFKSLQVLDVRGSSLGDHEISCFQSIDSLTHLFLEPPKKRPSQIVIMQDKNTIDRQSLKTHEYLSHGHCVCYTDKTPEKDCERLQCMKQEIPKLQQLRYSNNNTCDNNIDVCDLVFCGESKSPRPYFDNIDLVDDVDTEMLITDQGILALGNADIVVLDSELHPFQTTVYRNQNLTDLMILNCKAVTDLTLTHLAMLTSLKNLNVCGTSVSPDGIQRFRTQRPDVKIISNYSETTG